ncbi:MAG: NUDIX hydrolase [Lachnospiraceae bacterium]|nr:NUDIX hydrolase [Lachnospiraceae bacterium]
MKFLRIEKKDSEKYLHHYELVYLNKNGKEKSYEMVSRHEINTPEDLGNVVSGVSIVVYRGDKMLLLHEFRMGVNRNVYNLVAGLLEPGETMQECIERELYEETGLKLTRIYHILPPSFAAVAISDVKTHIAFVEAEGEIEDHSSANEEIEARFYSREEIAALLETGDFSSRAQMAAYYFSKGFYPFEK